ncbi:MAG: hypothetical protein UR61_C0052G0004 [candidate division WS6 bacterium GW2011_GWE1_34_7]|uniref:Uncharacterized protein n=2 Tax=Candidatus Dojkabacteria TaxID=74243 RepID=A0A0G0E9Z3_9BACT|nr:MAG: hypothetical protein UR61_C0052G0004 [candidate division WS6 bacterium GW2011_GWE1_34_7]KKP77790.1 MAG: hypothetical protein UR73_C0011G0004 [candidate division WS6 bacterium GW2011_GWF1_35_23]
MAQKYSSSKFKNDYKKEAANSHKAGDNIMITLSALDKKWGRYFYPLRINTYDLLYKDANKHYLKALSLLNEARALELGKIQNARLIFNSKFLDNSFLTVSKYLTSYYLLLEYFATENLWILNNVNDYYKLGFHIDDNVELTGRLRMLDSIIKDKTPLPNSTHTILAERDFLMHPTFRRMFPTEKLQNWKENLVGWFLSGEIEGTLPELQTYIINKQAKIKIFNDKLPKTKVTLTVKRGLVAVEPSKRGTNVI